MTKYIRTRLKEPSTWAGISGALAGVVSIANPVAGLAIVKGGALIASALAIFMPESGAKEK